jgi:hypothetical protein
VTGRVGHQPSEVLHVAYPELVRMAPDALRAAGFSVAQADEAAEALAWTEAATGRALAFLRAEHVPDSRTPFGGARPRRNGPKAAVNLDGASLLETGSRLFDLACALTSGGAAGQVLGWNVRGAVFVPYLAQRVATRGYELTVRFLGRSTPSEGDVAVAQVATRIPRAGGRSELLVMSPEAAHVDHPAMERPEQETWAGLLASALGVPRVRAAEELSAGVAGSGAVLIDCSPICQPGATVEEVESPLRPPYERADGVDRDYHERVDHALRTGLRVRAEDYSTFTSLYRSMRVPTSERSRMQAG